MQSQLEFMIYAHFYYYKGYKLLSINKYIYKNAEQLQIIR
jgi:hypothetical protein